MFGAGAENVQRAAIVGGRDLGALEIVAVGLVDRDHVGELDQALLDALQLVAADYRGALHILSPRSEHWHPPVETYSALTGDGIAKLWQKVLDHRKAMNASGEFAARRREQQVKWMWSMLEQRMLARLRSEASVRTKVKKIETEVAEGHLTPALAAEQILELLQ